MASTRTFYDVLRLGSHAQKGEIKENYRKLALRHHPDKDLGNPSATAEFQELYEAYHTLHDENRRILYDKKLREEHASPPRNTQQPRNAPRRNSRERCPTTSDSETDDGWKEGTKTSGEAHGRGRWTDSENKARERADSQAEQGKKEPFRRNRYEQPPPSEEWGEEDDDEWTRDAHQQPGRTDRQREAGDRAYTQAKEKEEREWSMEVQARLESLLQLRKKIETIKAKIEDMHQEDAEILESEQKLKNRTAYRTSIWDQITEKEETEQAKKRAERLQTRTAAMIKLSWAEKDLEQRENDYKTFLSMQSRQRREKVDRMEAALKAKTEHTAQQEAKQGRARDREIPERLAREKEETHKDAEARRREAERKHEEREIEREEARKAKSRETQKDEAARRQRLLEKIEKQKQETMRQDSRSPYSTSPKPNENGPNPTHVHAPASAFASHAEETQTSRSPHSRNHHPHFQPSNPTPARNPSTSQCMYRNRSYTSDSSSSSSEEGYCDHGDFWPKIKGARKCSNCARFCNVFVFQCPQCGVLACVSCRELLRRW